ncbi:MAG: hypothetical protein ABIH23_08560, partial [bacterium]
SKSVANSLAKTLQYIQIASQRMAAPFLNYPRLLTRLFRVWGEQNVDELVKDPTKIRMPVGIEDQHRLFAEGHASEPDMEQPLQQAIMEIMAHEMLLKAKQQSGEISPDEERLITEHVEQMKYVVGKKLEAMRQQMAMMNAGGAPNPGSTAQASLQPQKMTGPQAPEAGGLGRMGAQSEVQG